MSDKITGLFLGFALYLIVGILAGLISALVTKRPDKIGQYIRENILWSPFLFFWRAWKRRSE